MQRKVIQILSEMDQFGMRVLRLGIVVVFLWIGALKFFTYEADGIVPFVANSPFMSFFYSHPEDYKKHINKEGELIPENHQWHTDNNTYRFSKCLGLLLIALSVLVALHSVFPLLSMIGSFLLIFVMLGTLSFLITTPECWVPHITDKQWGFPYLSARGRLVIKDLVILGGVIITMSNSAKLYLKRNPTN